MRKYQVTLYTLAVLFGVLVGVYITKSRSIENAFYSTNKVDELMNLVHDNYVDSLSMEDIIEQTMPKILTELDPHSTYIPAKDVEETTADLKSSFSGIGIRFIIQDDTIHINEVVRKGPSEKVGLLPGDRIVTIDDSLFVGKVCTNDEAMKRLKGPKGTEVKLGIKRYGEKELLDFLIIRDDIPLQSIEAAYLIDGKWGYIQVDRFAENTFAEFMLALAKFRFRGCEGIIIDLRGNGGGWMGIALQMANEFLQKGDIIVYTEGEHHPKVIEYANGGGNFLETPLVVLTDETSASASEIIAGTIQDNDRGTIIGRRTFGKGLVQQPFEFVDGSLVRLTIARYYTPSGRCIQKPYDKGDDKEYEMDIVKRYERGEFFSQDSIHQNDSLVFKTRLGRTVYGGGGIMPDIFVSSDTTDVTSYFNQAVSRRLIPQFCLRYSDAHRKELSVYTTWDAMLEHLQTQPLLDEFVAYADKKGLKRRYNHIMKSRKLIERSIYANIIYDILGMLEHVKYINTFDVTVLKAIEVLESGKAFPTMPVAAQEDTMANDSILSFV
ncbi:MAG: S41 family peptidase [Bacteroidaceae bacterium]|nr:S41 family peptidase [Bacteroidaceae bacterium]